ncbi:hypothetical protein OYT1_ch0414 [Ferriphaselus amnicola]|uniref:Uncharacterized protein n=2 Tax=Ferriphaselus amnicola TaxID=1188319 RepID=A0A2Z6G945_9PROT|nr:hypothetical protein OYT1_ch0414 [Ferriphaselus amnicola]
MTLIALLGLSCSQVYMSIESKNEIRLVAYILVTLCILVLLILDQTVFRPIEPASWRDQQFLEKELALIVSSTDDIGVWQVSETLRKRNSLVVSAELTPYLEKTGYEEAVVKSLHHNGWKLLSLSSVKTSVSLCKDKYRASVFTAREVGFLGLEFSVKQYKSDQAC